MADIDEIKLEAMRTEYISSNPKTSYRKLGEKYDECYRTIARIGKEEDWEGLRSQTLHKTVTKTVEKISDTISDRAVAMVEVADLILVGMKKGIVAFEELPPSAAKNYSDALEKLKGIYMIRSEEDIEEQKARIAKLQKDAQDEDKNKTITITLEGDLSRYAQ